MKKLILTTLMTVAAAGAFAQGTVNFLNDTVTLSTPPDRFIRFGTAQGALAGTPAFGTNIQVQLYYGASTAPENALIAVTTAPARLRASTSTATGTWSAGGFRTLTGFDFGAGTVNLQLRAWDINLGATYELAAQNPLFQQSLSGKSSVFAYLIPASSGAPGGDFVMKNFTSFAVDAIIPEPSTFALAGLGAAALLIFRRRK
jgi:hypothetical protein